MRSQTSKKSKRAVLLFGTNFVELKERKYRPWCLFFFPSGHQWSEAFCSLLTGWTFTVNCSHRPGHEHFYAWNCFFAWMCTLACDMYAFSEEKHLLKQLLCPPTHVRKKWYICACMYCGHITCLQKVKCRSQPNVVVKSRRKNNRSCVPPHVLHKVVIDKNKKSILANKEKQ